MLLDCVLLARSLSVLWPPLAPSLLLLLELPGRAEGTDGSACSCLALSRTSSHPDHSPGPHVSLQGHQPLPQRCHIRVGLQLPTALTCPAMDPSMPGLTARLTWWPSRSEQAARACQLSWLGSQGAPGAWPRGSRQPCGATLRFLPDTFCAFCSAFSWAGRWWNEKYACKTTDNRRLGRSVNSRSEFKFRRENHK